MVLADSQVEHEKKFMDCKKDAESNVTNVIKGTTDVIPNRTKEENDSKDGFSFRSFLRERKDFTQLLQITEKIRKAVGSVKENNSCISEAPRNYERLKMEHAQLSFKLDQLGKQMNELKKIMEQKQFDLKPALDIVAKSVRDSMIEGRRCNVRREFIALRRINQLRAANLNRGLVMDVDAHGASESDSAFDLTSLDKALPPVSHCKRVPKVNWRSGKLEDMVINRMKENRLMRLARSELCLVDPTTTKENS